MSVLLIDFVRSKLSFLFAHVNWFGVTCNFSDVNRTAEARRCPVRDERPPNPAVVPDLSRFVATFRYLWTSWSWQVVGRRMTFTFRSLFSSEKMYVNPIPGRWGEGGWVGWGWRNPSDFLTPSLNAWSHRAEAFWPCLHIHCTHFGNLFLSGQVRSGHQNRSHDPTFLKF